MSYLLGFYGDDFTGSTDVMEALTSGGVPTVLFLAPPSRAQLAAFPDAKAVGIAGTSRTMTPAEMDEQLPEMFEALAALEATFCHYKVCSTFDSSPSVGSIGRALELGLEHFPQAFAPLLVGAPALKRYVAFGNLFAGADGVTHRLDRHPTMRRHPVTPMLESDLRLHLAEQTKLETALVDMLTLEQGVEAGFECANASSAKVILFDTLNDAHLATLGELLFRLQEKGIRFVAGSSGLEYALVAHLQAQGKATRHVAPTRVTKAETLLVMSGSAAPATAAQIDEAERRGFAAIRIDAPALIHPERRAQEHERLKRTACEALARGQSVILYAVRGPDDPALGATRSVVRSLGYEPSAAGRRLGAAQGKLLRDVLEATGIRRVCVAGGDTCGYAATQLELYALELLTPIAPGSPLCLAHSENPTFDGLELSLKAGQVGQPDYFLSVRKGSA